MRREGDRPAQVLCKQLEEQFSMEGRAIVPPPGFHAVHSGRLGGPALLVVAHARNSQLGAEAELPTLRARDSIAVITAQD